MKAFLLAAGLGTRLRPLTDKTPKCLLPLGGKPLLQIWLELLGRHGVEEVVINTHWHHEKVEVFVEGQVNSYSLLVNAGIKNNAGMLECWNAGIMNTEVRGQRSEIGGQGKTEVRERQRSEVRRKMKDEREKIKDKPNIKLFHEPKLLGSGGTLLANREWVANGKHFFILYGDNLTNVNLSKMYEFHLGHGLPFTLGVFRADEPERCGIAEIDEDGLVVDFVEKPDKPKSDLAAAGIYVADQRIFDFFPENSELIRPLDLGFHIIPNLVGKMRAYYIEEFLMDIGTVDSYEKAQAIYPQITQIDAD